MVSESSGVTIRLLALDAPRGTRMMLPEPWRELTMPASRSSV